MNELITYLNGIHQLSASAQQDLTSISSELTVKKNEEIHPIGHTCRNLYFIKKGLLCIFYFKGEREIIESFEFENSIVARGDSVFRAVPSRKGIKAIEDSELVAINAAELFKLYDQHHDIERLFRKIFENAYVELLERIESIQFNTAEERYQHLLKHSRETILRVPLKLTASYLGITQVSLSRIRAKK